MENQDSVDLDNRVRKLEQKVELLISIADCEKHPFICACLEADMDTDQVDKALDLISRAEHSLKAQNPMNFSKFEQEIFVIVPAQKGNREFAKSLLRALYSKDRFIGLYEKFKKDGIDL